MTPEKIDLCKLHKEEYAAPKKPVLLEIKPATYLAINGKGAPGGAAFEDKMGALYGMAFTIKMTRKFAGKGDYAVGKLEAQWWAENCNFAQAPKEEWCWKVFIRTPDFIAQEDLNDAVAVLLKRGKSPTVREVRLENITEGLCVQMLHVGPYDRECETFELMKAFAEKNGCEFHGIHHEIYISDPRRVPPEKLKTILRHPVKRRE